MNLYYWYVTYDVFIVAIQKKKLRPVSGSEDIIN